MKKISLKKVCKINISCSIILCVLSIAPGAQLKKMIYQINPEKDQYVCIDATKYTAKMNNWVVGNSAEKDSSKRTYVSVPEQAGKEVEYYRAHSDSITQADGSHVSDYHGAVVSYFINVTAPCNLQIFTYQYCLDGASNSIYINMDDDVKLTVMQGNYDSYFRWLWHGSPKFVFNLQKGIHKLNIVNREPSTCVSQILLRVNNADASKTPGDAKKEKSALSSLPFSKIADPDFAYNYDSSKVSVKKSVKVEAIIVSDKNIFAVPFIDSFWVNLELNKNVRGYIIRAKWLDWEWGQTASGAKTIRLWKNETDKPVVFADVHIKVGYVKTETYSFDEMYNISKEAFVDSFYIGNLPKGLVQNNSKLH